MDAKIIEQDDEWVGIEVRDNCNVEHKIGVEFDGEIKGHSQDGYSDDPSERTKAENEHVKQARRYARYHVYRERGYETLPPRERPSWLAVVASVIADLPLATFEEHFEDYYRQLRSQVEADVEPVVEPPGEDAAGLTVYLLNVHLDADPEALFGGDRAAALLESLAATDDVETILAEIRDALADRAISPDAFGLAGVSEIGVLYQGATQDVEEEGADPHPGPADARLELAPTEIPGEDYLPLEGFQLLVVHHLLCQARDRYLAMGEDPPEGLRVLGLGTYRQSVRNEHLEMYPPVHSTSTPVVGYSLPDVGPGVEP